MSRQFGTRHWGSFFFFCMLLRFFQKVSICFFFQVLFFPILVSLRMGCSLVCSFLPVLLFSKLLFLYLGRIIFLYLFCYFLLFYFSIPQVDPLPLPLEYGPSPHSLRMYGLACVSATLVGYSCLLRIFYLLLFLFKRLLYSVLRMPWLCRHVFYKKYRWLISFA